MYVANGCMLNVLKCLMIVFLKYFSVKSVYNNNVP